MQLTIKYQTAFKRDYKRIKKRGYDTRLLEAIVEKLAPFCPPWRFTVSLLTARQIASEIQHNLLFYKHTFFATNRSLWWKLKCQSKANNHQW